MRYSFFINILLILFLSSSAFSEVIDRIVAIVDDEPITYSELEGRSKFFLMRNPGLNSSPERLLQVYNQILLQMIDEKLIENEARKKNIKITDEDIDLAISSVLQQNSITLDELKAKLLEDGISYEQYRMDIRNQLLRIKLVNLAVRAKVVVSEEEISEQLKKEIKKTDSSLPKDGEIYILKQIAVLFKDPNDPKERENALSKIMRADSELNKGVSFDRVAREYSDLYDENKPDKGLIAGAFTLDELAPQLREQIIKLKPNEKTTIIKTAGGFFIFQLKERVKGTDAELAKIDPFKKEQIKEQLYREKLNQTFEEWIKEIRQKATIKILL